MNALEKIIQILFNHKSSGAPESQISTGATTQPTTHTPQHYTHTPQHYTQAPQRPTLTAQTAPRPAQTTQTAQTAPRPAQTTQRPQRPQRPAPRPTQTAQTAQRPGAPRSFFPKSADGAKHPHVPVNSGSALTVYDPQHTPVRLGAIDQKGSGGEGAVYQLPDKPAYLIKIYKPETLANRCKVDTLTKRIMDMQVLESWKQQPYLAWPKMVVYDDRRQVIGFAMAKCSGISFKSLCGPARISKLFPGWDRLMLARVALDFVQKLHRLAQDGVLVNDFNPSNFLVDQAGNVSFIDCDSFQVPAAAGGVHGTQTYFPDYVAPEIMKDTNLLKQPRTIHQVEFAGAMIIFHILMCGQYPYNHCARSNQKPLETPEDKLKQGDCPYGAGAGVQLPGGSWQELWNRLTDGIKRSLVTTFCEGHADPRRRTSLPQLQHDLKELIEAMQNNTARRQLLLGVSQRQPGRPTPTPAPAAIGRNRTAPAQKAQPASQKNKAVARPAGHKNKPAAHPGAQKNKPAAHPGAHKNKPVGQPAANQNSRGAMPGPTAPKKKKNKADVRKNQLAGAYIVQTKGAPGPRKGSTRP